MFTTTMKWWMSETLPLWLHHKVDQTNKDVTTPTKKWMFSCIKKKIKTKCLSSNEKNECLIASKSEPKQNAQGV
jgi:hypothetical protein